jgi:hypothetical protein
MAGERELPEDIRAEVVHIREQMGRLANELDALERRAFEAKLDEAIAMSIGVAAVWLKSASRHELARALGERES